MTVRRPYVAKTQYRDALRREDILRAELKKANAVLTELRDLVPLLEENRGNRSVGRKLRSVLGMPSRVTVPAEYGDKEIER